MKKHLIIIATILSTVIPFSCKKSNNPAPSPSTSNTYFDFLKNTQWVGILARSGYQYAPPCCIRVNADTTIAVYASFIFLINNALQYVDSIKGKINSMDSLPDGRTKIKIKFNYIGDVEIYITNREQLTSNYPDINKPTPFEAVIFPKEVDVKGSTWSGPVMTGQSATGFAYPDLSRVIFSADKPVTIYTRNGLYCADNDKKVVEMGYSQKGAMVFFYGFDETNDLVPRYFGVLLPSEDKMMIYSGSMDARLPYYTQSTPWYGPLGVTPIIDKQ